MNQRKSRFGGMRDASTKTPSASRKTLTPEAAEKCDRKLLKKLRKAAGAEPLKGCSSKRRCRRLSCNFCRVAGAMEFVKEHLPECQEAMKAQAEGGSRVESITILLASGRVAKGALQKKSLIQMRNKVMRWLRDYAPEAEFLMGMDISLNTDKERPTQDHWMVHAHGVAINLSPKSKRKLTKFLKSGPGAGTRPLVTKEIWDLRGWLEYIARPSFDRRRQVQLKRGPDTNKDTLSLKDQAELALWLRQYKVKQRYGKVGFRV